MFSTGVCHSVHNQPHGYWFTAHPCYGAVGSILLQCFLVWHIVWRKLHGFEEKWTEGAHVCYQSPQPPGCSFLAVLEGRKGYKLLTKNCYYQLLPPANEVSEGYVFTGVYLSTGGGVSAPLHAGIHIPQDQRQTPPWDQTPPRTDTPGQQAGGTHPTGMHTCLCDKNTTVISKNTIYFTLNVDPAYNKILCNQHPVIRSKINGFFKDVW